MTIKSLARTLAGMCLTGVAVMVGCGEESDPNAECADGEIVNDDPEDCVRTACRGGSFVVENVNSEIPDDGFSCTIDSCEGGKKLNVVQVDSACKIGNTEEVGVCDDVGRCVVCTTGTPCEMGFSCFMGKCWSCTDGVLNGAESDIDCGEGCGIACMIGERCRSPLDCQPGADCDNDECVSCTDNILNGNESDVDCGGNCPNRCADTLACRDEDDCESGVCTGDVCVAPTCNDMVQNGTETDVDCGSTCTNDCAEDQGCEVKEDCQGTLLCTNKICTPP